MVRADSPTAIRVDIIRIQPRRRPSGWRHVNQVRQKPDFSRSMSIQADGPNGFAPPFCHFKNPKAELKSMQQDGPIVLLPRARVIRESKFPIRRTIRADDHPIRQVRRNFDCVGMPVVAAEE